MHSKQEMTTLSAVPTL